MPSEVSDARAAERGARRTARDVHLDRLGGTFVRDARAALLAAALAAWAATSSRAAVVNWKAPQSRAFSH